MNDDDNVLPARMLGLFGFRVLAAREYGGELELLMESTDTVIGCPVCGVVATAHGRRDHLVRDIPARGPCGAAVWRMRLWRCDEAVRVLEAFHVVKLPTLSSTMSVATVSSRRWVTAATRTIRCIRRGGCCDVAVNT